MISENNDRNVRKSNIINYNVAETKVASEAVSSERDKENMTDCLGVIAPDLCGSDVNNIKIGILGRPNPDKCGPIRIK